MTRSKQTVLRTLLECGATVGGAGQLHQGKIAELSLLASSTVNSAVRGLAEAGLVQVEREGISPVETGRPERLFYQLTDAGEELARGLASGAGESARSEGSGGATMSVQDLVNELVTTAGNEGMLVPPRGTATRDRITAIGTALNQAGGQELMLDVHAAVSRAVGPILGRELEAAWDGIGSWHS